MSTDQDESEREDLQELLSMPGFQRFMIAMLKEYSGRGYRERMRAALINSSDPNIVALEARVVERMAVEVERMFEYPERRIEELSIKETDA